MKYWIFWILIKIQLIPLFFELNNNKKLCFHEYWENNDHFLLNYKILTDKFIEDNNTVIIQLWDEKYRNTISKHYIHNLKSGNIMIKNNFHENNIIICYFTIVKNANITLESNLSKENDLINKKNWKSLKIKTLIKQQLYLKTKLDVKVKIISEEVNKLKILKFILYINLIVFIIILILERWVIIKLLLNNK